MDRTENDSLGEVIVPEQALYGAATARALHNFSISGLRIPELMIGALAQIKAAAAQANRDLGLLEPGLAAAITAAAAEVTAGAHTEQFPLDIFQTGSGTSTNMNVNEVIANRASELLGGRRGEKRPVHPNDHVNLSQSSNDVFPSALQAAGVWAIRDGLLPAAEDLAAALERQAVQFALVVKAGRTHLQDAVPITLGQEFGGYAALVRQAGGWIQRALPPLAELPLGGTAVGTGLNAPPEFAARTLAILNRETASAFTEAENHVAAQMSRDAVVSMSGQLRVLAGVLMKIAEDLRWLASGPRCGLGEIALPALQPGSSIMPGKVNPVICESVLMGGAQVIGNDACVAECGRRGNFELNTMMPVMAYNFLQSIQILAALSVNFAQRCIAGITADRERCRRYAESSPALCTALAPVIGYDRAAQVNRLAVERSCSLQEAAQVLGIGDPEVLRELLDVDRMAGVPVEKK